jgi:imidazolonepropionase
MIEDAAVLCFGGKIVSVGAMKDALRDPWLKKNRKRVTEIDCAGRVVLPGFVDSHTHPVFTQPRLVDFEKRVAGASYEEIAEAGGGIRSSIEGVRGASKATLTEHVVDALDDLGQYGTTTVEAKSGYGLSFDSEIKSLEAIRAAAKRWPGTVVPTFLGAHVVPPEYRGRSEPYVELVCKEMMAAVAKSKLARFVDVFCDRGAFSEKDTATIFGAAAAHGLEVRAHLGQLTSPSAGFIESMLQTRQPASLDHMDYVNDADLPALARSSTVATFVPGANYFLGLSRYPDARRFIEAGAAVALATDYNPGSSPTLSMPMAMSLACTHMKMKPAEAIAAATINGASALRMVDRKGSIEPGKDADLAVFDVNDYREIAYWFGLNRCVTTVANGIRLGEERW